MPRIFWTPTQDQILRANYPLLGPASTASLLGISRRSAVNRAHRLNLKAPYPKGRACPSRPSQSWSPAEKLLAEVLLDLLRSDFPTTDIDQADFRNIAPGAGDTPDSA